ncbi:MAG: YmdB family metallophosphoesterase [Spirochaetales bacterium]|nr:YmdB family metallophosphoesterase [Spirochaetales bacterium]
MNAGHRVLMIGDIVGDAGIHAFAAAMPALLRELRPDLVVANGENAAAGIGLTRHCADAIFAAGVDVITSGNHIWEKKGAAELLKGDPRILRPANYPARAPGTGLFTAEKGGARWVVVNLQGREGMSPIDNPFARADELLAGVEPGSVVVVDFHAESFAEKEALSLYLDGRVAAFAGTHTHVQTADERILPRGTGYIGDLGMSGPSDSVIGVKVDACLRRNISQMPIKMEVAEGDSTVSGALFELDADGRCLAVRRVRV